MYLSKASVTSIAKAFSTPSWWYDLRGMFLVTFSYRSTVVAQICFFAQNLSTRHLEVPIGNGSILDLVLKWHRLRSGGQTKIVAIDISLGMLKSSTKRFKKAQNVKIEHGDIAQLKYQDNSFDTVNIANGFHCFPDPGAAWTVLARKGRTYRYPSL